MSDKPKKVRCTCRRCEKVKYEKATIDRTVPYLCPDCNDLHILWEEGGGVPAGLCLEADAEKCMAAFLKTRPFKK